MAFADLVPSEEFFIDYLTKRLEMYKDDRLANIDEMDMLGLYYENDMKLDKEMKHMHLSELNGYSTVIQDYFDGRRPSSQQKRNSVLYAAKFTSYLCKSA